MNPPSLFLLKIMLLFLFFAFCVNFTVVLYLKRKKERRGLARWLDRHCITPVHVFKENIIVILWRFPVCKHRMGERNIHSVIITYKAVEFCFWRSSVTWELSCLSLSLLLFAFKSNMNTEFYQLFFGFNLYNYVIFSLLLIWWDILFSFQILNHLCIPGGNPVQSLHVVVSGHCWVWCIGILFWVLSLFMRIFLYSFCSL